MIILLTISFALADEGMWVPSSLRKRSTELREAGLALPIEAISDFDQPILQSIVSLEGCSGSFLSSQGLIATNYHCIQSFLPSTSDTKDNELIAASNRDEYPIAPFPVSVITSVRDVTERMSKGIGRWAKPDHIAFRHRRNRSYLVRNCEKGPDYHCSVKRLNDGDRYLLVQKRAFNDVRIVYAPARSIGSYGGEKENWRWPRHTGDFALLRVYTGPNGENAFYDEANIPYRNPHFLRISPEGISDKDFVLSIGYPRSTSRHSLYRELRYAKDVRYPFLIDLSTRWLSIIDEHMEQDPNAQRLFAAKQMISNTLVQNRGMLTNFSREDLLKTKSEQEQSFIRWSAKSPDREIYASAIKDLEASIQKTSQHNLIDYLAWLSWSADLLYAAQSSYSWALERKKKDADRLPGYQNHNKIQFVSRIRTQDQRLYLPADKDLLRYMLQRPEVQSLPSLQEWIQKQGGVNQSISRLFSSLDILDTQTQLRLLDEPSEYFESSKNPWLELSVRVETLRRQLQAQQKEETERQKKLRVVLVEGKEKANPVHFYPDADHSIRVGYGHVRGYRPKDALVYESQTTVAGQIEKLGPPPFDLPPHIVEQAAFRSQSPHIAPELNDIPCNFSTDLDISNGSSGSATLNAKGEWVGMVFDGNEGSMSNRWLYHPRFSRAIHVDVRYMLWYMETTATAQWIVRELLQDK